MTHFRFFSFIPRDNWVMKIIKSISTLFIPKQPILKISLIISPSHLFQIFPSRHLFEPLYIRYLCFCVYFISTDLGRLLHHSLVMFKKLLFCATFPFCKGILDMVKIINSFSFSVMVICLWINISKLIEKVMKFLFSRFICFLSYTLISILLDI